MPNHEFSRRALLGATAGAAALGAFGRLSEGAAQAVSLPRKAGRLSDVEHVVILMQENRSFDHYYGSMRGVRGFSDRAALRLPTGKSVLYQPDTARTDGGALLPFHVDTKHVDGQDLGDLDHGWVGTHQAWDAGRYDAWVPAKTEMTMGYFTQDDLPFQRALAGAFTVCDNYFCSVQGPTTPNRLYLWTGMIDPHGLHGGPVISNPDDYLPVLSWTTYPERLEAAGVSWQVYANDEVGDDGSHPFCGDYGDNPLWLFKAYHDSLASPDPHSQRLAKRGGLHNGWKPDSGQGTNTSHVLAQFIADCASGQLPRVSWVVAPYGYSEHPAARPVDGAAYVARVLQAIWGNHELRDSTVLFIDYDENDGFFDHLPPPTAPLGTADEYVLGLPIGLGPRVPMTVVSPWSRGGYVNSEVADHTSVIRFLETWTGVHEPNISAWRRSLCGDLTSCFDFSKKSTPVPTLPDTAKLRRQADRTESQLPPSSPPLTGAQVVPVQDGGSAPARPLPYQPSANASPNVAGTLLQLALANAGSRTLQLAVYPYHLGATPPQVLDIPAGGSRTTNVLLTPTSAYDVAVHGPNGFLREFAGDGASTRAAVLTTLVIAGPKSQPSLKLTLVNKGAAAVTFRVANRLGSPASYKVAAGSQRTLTYHPLDNEHGWYDLTVTAAGLTAFSWRFAGHLENGRPSRTG